MSYEERVDEQLRAIRDFVLSQELPPPGANIELPPTPVIPTIDLLVVGRLVTGVGTRNMQ